MRQVLRVAAGLLAVGLASAASLELAVRVLGLAPPLMSAYEDNVPDPHIPYKRRPGSLIQGRWHTDEFDFEFRHNTLGFRDVEHEESKPEGAFRILVLGDSFAYGAGADFDATWSSAVERMLNGRVGPHPHVELIRMGLPRYFPGAERLVLEHYGLRFRPDLVLVGVLPNDVLDTHEGLGAIEVDRAGSLRTREGKYLGQVGRWLFVHSHVMRILLPRVLEAIRQRESPERWEDVYRDAGLHEDDWVQMESDLAAIDELARSGGAELVLVSVPQRGPWDDSHRYPGRRLAAWSDRRGVPFVDALPHLEQAAPGPPLYWERDGHCTPQGYAVIARAVADFLVERRLVP